MECRTLLAAPLPTATWIGQDGHDLVGPYSTPGPDDVQDIHIALAGLPAGLAITQANIVGDHGGQWMYNGPPNGPWAAALLRTPGSTTADLYLDPYQVETGRYFFINLTYSDQSTAFISFMGGTADPNLRMPGTSVTATWLGQDGHDWTGPGAAVGPDGFQDAHISLANLSSTVAIQSATLTASGGASWAFGTNPGLLPDAELIPNSSDPSRGDLYFSPQTDLTGQTLTLTINYADGKSDSVSLVAGSTQPGLRMPAPPPVTVTENALSTQWLGQDGLNLTGAGDIHLALSGLPAGHTVVAAQLTDGTRNSWDYTTPGATLSDANVNAMTLGWRLSSTEATQADVTFAPIRDESQSILTLRLVLDDGSNLVTTFTGGTADLSLRAPQPAATSVVAQPGADLNALASQYGSIHLSAGTYNLSSPLVLNQPVAITADPGTTLLFTQDPAAPTWTAAIKIKAGNTTLEGFAVRFAGPIRWTSGISYGPAVIGTTDNFDTGSSANLVNIRLTNLDLQSPPASSAWETAPSLIRVTSALNGVISGNELKGGTTEFLGGPWQITGNTYLGTVPNTYTSTVFAGHYTHDLVLTNNQAQPVGSSGKTYRFLVLTQSGLNDLVKNNNVVGIGPQDSDTEPNPNASEVVLAEAYYVMYEGVPLTISPDGRVVQVSSVLAGTVQAGDVLSILAGSQAGQWRIIAQALNPTTFLLSSPIDMATSAISISTGFVNESFIGNTIDTRGSSTAADLVLAGNQFGLSVLNNQLIGGDRGFWITAFPSQTPSIWGWTHAPVLGATISGNVIQDTISGGLLQVDHSAASKSDVGRVYLTATLTNNTGIFTDAFVNQSAQARPGAPLRALTIGMTPSNDPGELLVAVAGNQVEGPASVDSSPVLYTVEAVVNGQATTSQGTVLPAVAVAAPVGLALVNDTGVSNVDGQTSDPSLHFLPVALAAGYEYSLTGAAGSYQPIASPSSFLPSGLSPGFNTVYVRAYDAIGDRGPDTLILFAYVPSSADTSTSDSPGASRSIRYLYRIASSGNYVALGTPIVLSAALEAQGPISLQVEMLNGDGTVSPVSTGSAGATGSTGQDPSSAGSGGSVPPSSAGDTSAGQSGSAAASGSGVLPTNQVFAPPQSLINRPMGKHGSAGSVPAGVKLTHGPALSRHPNPFRSGGSGVSTRGLHHQQASPAARPAHGPAKAHHPGASDRPRATGGASALRVHKQ